MSAVPSDVSNSLSLLKAVFSSEIPRDSLVDAGSTWAMIRQAPAGGRSYTWGLRDSYAQSRGNTMPKAAANARTQNMINFTLPNGDSAYPEYNSYGSLQNKLLASAMNAPSRDAFDNIMSIVNGSRAQHYIDLSAYLWGDGTGALGEVAAVTATTVTLKLYTDIVKFNVEGTYTSSSSVYSTEPTNGAVLTGISFDGATSTLVFDAVPAGIAVDDFLFADGVYATGVGEGVMLGIPAYIVPENISVATDFLGVDRSVNRNMRAGFSQDGTNGSFTSNLTKLVYSMSMFGQRGRTLVMNDKILQKLQLQQDGTILRDTNDQSGMSLLGFSKWKANFMGAGDFDIYTDKFVPGDKAYIIDPSMLEYRYLAMCDSDPTFWAKGLSLNTGTMSPDIPLVLDPVNNVWQYQLYTYGQLICTKPSSFGCIFNLVP